MKKTIHAFAAKKQGARLEPFTYETEDLGPHEIFVKVSHCGICHSDLHLIDDDWEFTEYPLVPGHEIIGTIEAKGSLVDYLDIGERVGIGWQGKSCMACEWCLTGDENLCPAQEPTCVGHYGGFSEALVADSRFSFPIPKEISSAEAGPLLCGGATVFSPILEHNIRPTHKVAVVGIGGLGHLALQFLSKCGCEVTALSSSPEKEAEAKKFGADHFLNVKEKALLEEKKNCFDFILSASIHGLDWPLYLNMLRPRGKICLLGALEEKLDAPIMGLVDCRKIICGSNIGSPPMIKKMLAFAAQHNVRPLIEEFPLSKVNEAIDKLRAGKMRYRAVLINK